MGGGRRFLLVDPLDDLQLYDSTVVVQRGAQHVDPGLEEDGLLEERDERMRSGGVWVANQRLVHARQPMPLNLHVDPGNDHAQANHYDECENL